MKHSLILTPTLLYLCGCATQVDSSIQFVRKNPKTEAVVRYIQPQSPNSNVDYVSELNHEATQFCDGNYEIKNKFPAMSDAGALTDRLEGKSFLLAESDNKLAKYDYVEFACK